MVPPGLLCFLSVYIMFGLLFFISSILSPPPTILSTILLYTSAPSSHTPVSNPHSIYLYSPSRALYYSPTLSLPSVMIPSHIFSTRTLPSLHLSYPLITIQPTHILHHRPPTSHVPGRREHHGLHRLQVVKVGARRAYWASIRSCHRPRRYYYPAVVIIHS